MNAIIILLWSALGLMILGYSFYYGFWLGKKRMSKAIIESDFEQFSKKAGVIFENMTLAENLMQRVEKTDFGPDTEIIRHMMYEMITDELKKSAGKVSEQFEKVQKTINKQVKKTVR